jgi:hypothetical protein
MRGQGVTISVGSAGSVSLAESTCAARGSLAESNLRAQAGAKRSNSSCAARPARSAQNRCRRSGIDAGAVRTVGRSAGPEEDPARALGRSGACTGKIRRGPEEDPARALGRSRNEKSRTGLSRRGSRLSVVCSAIIAEMLRESYLLRRQVAQTSEPMPAQTLKPAQTSEMPAQEPQPAQGPQVLGP